MHMLDSDVIRKLCQYELLEEFIYSLSQSLDCFYILPQLRFQLKLNNYEKALKLLGSEKSVLLAHRIISECKEVVIPSSDFTTEIFNFLDIPNIDPGEATLFAAMVCHGGSRLITGDKRALTALCFINELSSYRLWPRILCLEEAFLMILSKGDFSSISQKVRLKPNVDISLSLIFGRTVSSDFNSVFEGLISNINDLIFKTKDNYCYPKSWN